MGSLSDLNTYSQTTVEFTDERNPGPRFNIPEVLDQAFTATTNPFTIERDGLEIIEIVRPDDANITLSVDVSAVSGATVNWPILFSGSTVTTGGGIYTIGNISSISDWESARTAQITVPDTFQGSFFYDVEIAWFSDAGRQTLSWQVGSFVPVTNMTSTTELAAQGKQYKGVLNETFYALFSSVGVGIDFVDFEADIVMQTGISINADKFRNASANLNSNASMTASARTDVRGAANLVATNSLSVSETYRAAISNLIDRTYLSNQKNDLYQPNIPTINSSLELAYPTETFEVTFTVGAGEFDNGSNTKTVSGTRTQCNQAIAALDYYPDYNYTGNTTTTLRLRILDGLTEIISRTETFALTYAGAGNAGIDNLYTFTTNGTWTPTLLEEKYGEASFFMIGGGGAGEEHISEIGGVLGNGGGAGEVVTGNLTSLLSSYAYTIGQGGTAPRTFRNFGNQAAGQDGTASTFAGFTAAGGEGGNVSAIPLLATPQQDIQPANGSSGSNPAGSDGSGTYTGGDPIFETASPTNALLIQGPDTSFQHYIAGGGGAGAGGAGQDGQLKTVNVSGVNYDIYYPGAGGSARLCNQDGNYYGYGGTGGLVSTGNTTVDAQNPTQYSTAGSGGHGGSGNFGGFSGKDGILVIKVTDK